MTSEQRLDRLERVAKLMVKAGLRARGQIREHDEKIVILIDAQIKSEAALASFTAETKAAFAKLAESHARTEAAFARLAESQAETDRKFIAFINNASGGPNNNTSN